MSHRAHKQLILLRGVPAAGKTQVSKVLYEKIGKNIIRLDLDKYAPDVEKKYFENMIENALDYNYVIGELYSGRWHTTDPNRWISKFKSVGFKINSFVLEVSLKKGYDNCCDPRHYSYQPTEYDDYCILYNRFYERQKLNIFASRAGLDTETSIDAEDSDWKRIADIILNEI